MNKANNHRYHFREDGKNDLRKQYGNAIVFTDTCENPCFHRVETDDLLPGELSAFTFGVGCYTVRTAWRVYKIHEPGYSPEQEMPADKDDVDTVRKDLGDGNVAELTGFLSIADVSGFANISKYPPEWSDKLRVTHEISAKHTADSDGVFFDGFKPVCRATESRNANWSETIGYICAIKDNASLPDNQASIVVSSMYLGSSFSVPHWHKLDYNGELSHISKHPYADSE